MQTAAYPKYLPLRMALALIFTYWHREAFCRARMGVFRLSVNSEGLQRVF